MSTTDPGADERAPLTDVAELGEFESDLTSEDWAAKLRADDLRRGPIFWAPIEVLSPSKTVGLGRTNLTLVRPTVVQTDTSVPFAGFDRRLSPNRNPAVSVHFNPGAYGATGPGTYVFTFAVDAPTRAHFTPSGFAGSGTVDAPGSIRFEGRRVITIILRDVPAGQDTFATIEQTAGESWSWLSTRIAHPPIIFEPIPINLGP